MYLDNAFENLKSLDVNVEHLPRIDYKSGKCYTHFLRLSPFYMETGGETRIGKI